MYLVPRSELGLQIGEVQDRHEVITPAVFQTCSKDPPNFVSVSRTFADALPHPLVRESDQADHSDREHPLASAKYRELAQRHSRRHAGAFGVPRASRLRAGVVSYRHKPDAAKRNGGGSPPPFRVGASPFA